MTFDPDLAGGSLAIVAVLVAVVGDILLGGLPGLRLVLSAPQRLTATLASWIDLKLNREYRSAASRHIRGLIVLAVFAGISGLVGLFVSRFTAEIGSQGWVVEALVMLFLLDQRRVFDALLGIASTLKRGLVDKARVSLERLAPYDTDTLDQHAVARGCIEVSATRLCDAIMGPLLWYLVLGLPGACMYRAITILADRIGFRSIRHAAFGFSAARLDTILSYPPALIVGAIVCIAAVFTPSANPARAFRTMLRDAHHHPSSRVGWPVGAVAGGLGLALVGPRRLGGEQVSGPWIGEGRAKATPQDVQRMAFLFGVCVALIVLVIVCLALFAAPI